MHSLRDYVLIPDGRFRVDKGLSCWGCRSTNQACSDKGKSLKVKWDDIPRTVAPEVVVERFKAEVNFVPNGEWAISQGLPAVMRRPAPRKRKPEDSESGAAPKRAKVTSLSGSGLEEVMAAPGPSHIPATPFVSAEEMERGVREAVRLPEVEEGEDQIEALRGRFQTDLFRAVFDQAVSREGLVFTPLETFALSLYASEHLAQLIPEKRVESGPADTRMEKSLAEATSSLARVEFELKRLQAAYNVVRNDSAGYRDSLRDLYGWMQGQARDFHTTAVNAQAQDRHYATGLAMVKKALSSVTDHQTRMEHEAPRQAINEAGPSAPAHIPSPRVD